MNAAHAVRSGVAGLVIYIVMAACGAAEQARVDGSGSSSTSGGGGVVDGALEAIADVWAEATDPVRDARAAPADFEVSTVACSKTFTDTFGRTILYAEQEYPGASAAELSHVTALVDIVEPGTTRPAGYTKLHVGVSWIGDGRVATVCPSGDMPPFTSVTFARRK